MRKISTRDLTLAAVVAAIYFVLCYFGDIFSLTFGPVQVRLGEALTVLPFLFPAAAPGARGPPRALCLMRPTCPTAVRAEAGIVPGSPDNRDPM